MSNNILQSFINQTYGSLENAKKIDALADLNPNAYTDHNIGDPNISKKIDEEAQKMAMKGRFTNKPIKDSMNIPTKLNDGEINQQTQSHQNFKNYDHSLEIHRGQKLGLIKIRDMPTGNVDELFDNMFTNDSNLVN